MNANDFDAGLPDPDGHGHDHDHDHDHEGEETLAEEALEEALELDTQSQIFLEMRRQNLDLLRLATEVAGYSGSHGPLKSGATSREPSGTSGTSSPSSTPGSIPRRPRTRKTTRRIEGEY